MKKIWLVVGILLLLSGCAKEEAKNVGGNSGKYPVTWSENIDGNDYNEKVVKAPTKAISMSQATTEMMLALGLEKNMVGTAFLEEEIYPSLKSAYDQVPVLSEKWPAYEVFMSSKPDFATGWPVPFTKRGIEASKIRGAGIPIYIPNSMQDPKGDLDTYFADMIELGKIFGVDIKAEKYVESEKKKLKEIMGKIAKNEPVKVFVFDSEDEQPFTVFEGYTTNLLKMINLQNIMSGRGSEKTWGKTTWEELVNGNPDYIIIVDYGTSIRSTEDFDGKVKKLLENPALQGVKAIQKKQFIRVKLSEITPGVRSVDALERISKQIFK